MINDDVKEKLSNLFATEEISKAVIAMGLNEMCLASHCGFKQFGEAYDKLKHKQLFFQGLEMLHKLQQKYDAPLYEICAAPTWQQITDWFQDEHDIDIEVTRIRQDPNFKYQFSVLKSGKLIDSSRTTGRVEALEKAVLSAINLKTGTNQVK